MNTIETLLRSKLKPKEKQTKLVASVCAGEIPVREFMDFFTTAADVDKGTCADVMKHVTDQKPEILGPHIDLLIEYVNYKAPRVKWGVAEAIGNCAEQYPEAVAGAIPALLCNAVENETNTTVIRWCAAYALSEIAKHNATACKKLVPVMQKLAKKEKNNGVKNVYLKALKRAMK